MSLLGTDRLPVLTSEMGKLGSDKILPTGLKTTGTLSMKFSKTQKLASIDSLRLSSIKNKGILESLFSDSSFQSGQSDLSTVLFPEAQTKDKRLSSLYDEKKANRTHTKLHPNKVYTMWYRRYENILPFEDRLTIQPLEEIESVDEDIALQHFYGSENPPAITSLSKQEQIIRRREVLEKYTKLKNREHDHSLNTFTFGLSQYQKRRAAEVIQFIRRRQIVRRIMAHKHSLKVKWGVLRQKVAAIKISSMYKELERQRIRTRFRKVITLVHSVIRFLDTISKMTSVIRRILRELEAFRLAGTKWLEERGAVMSKVDTKTFDQRKYRLSMQIELPIDVRFTLTKPWSTRKEGEINKAIHALQKYKGFVEFPLSFQRRIATLGWFIEIQKEKVIIRERQKAHDFYILLMGKAKMMKLVGSPDVMEPGEFHIVRDINVSEVFGEESMSDPDSLRSYSVVSWEPCALLSINVLEYSKFMMLSPDNESAPAHIRFLSGLSLMEHFPKIKLVEEGLENIIVTYFKPGTLVSKNLKESDYVYVVRSGTCRLISEIYQEKMVSHKEAASHLSEPKLEGEVCVTEAKEGASIQQAKVGKRVSVYAAKAQVRNSVRAAKAGEITSVDATKAGKRTSLRATKSRERTAVHETWERPPVHTTKAGERPPVHTTKAGERPSVHTTKAGERPPVHTTKAGERPPVHTTKAGERPLVHTTKPGERPLVHTAKAGKRPSVHTTKAGERPVHTTKAEEIPPVHTTKAGERSPVHTTKAEEEIPKQTAIAAGGASLNDAYIDDEEESKHSSGRIKRIHPSSAQDVYTLYADGKKPSLSNKSRVDEFSKHFLEKTKRASDTTRISVTVEILNVQMKTQKLLQSLPLKCRRSLTAEKNSLINPHLTGCISTHSVGGDSFEISSISDSVGTRNSVLEQNSTRKVFSNLQSDAKNVCREMEIMLKSEEKDAVKALHNMIEDNLAEDTESTKYCSASGLHSSPGRNGSQGKKTVKISEEFTVAGSPRRPGSGVVYKKNAEKSKSSKDPGVQKARRDKKRESVNFSQWCLLRLLKRGDYVGQEWLDYNDGPFEPPKVIMSLVSDGCEMILVRRPLLLKYLYKEW